MSTDYADIIKRAQRGPSSAKLAKEGRKFERHEWLEFECHPGKPTEDMRQIARDFTKRVVNLTDDWLVEHGKRELIGAADEDQLAWLAYASIVGHGVGLWEKEGSTGLPGDVEGSLDTIVKNDQIASRMAHALSDMCSLEREEHETAGKRIRGKGKRELNEQPRDPVLDELRAIHAELERAKTEGAKGIARLKGADKRVRALPKDHKLDRPDRESLADVSHFLAAAMSDRLATMKRAIRDNDRNAQNLDDATQEELSEILIDWAIDSLSAPIYRLEQRHAAPPPPPAAPTGRTYGVTLDGEPVDFADFLAQNKETFSPELVDRLRAMKPGDRYRGGGGAQPEWVLKYLPYDRYIVTWHEARSSSDASKVFGDVAAALDFARAKSQAMPGEIILVHAGPNKFGQDTELGYVKNGMFVDPEEEARRQRERFWGTPGAGEQGTVSMRNAIEIARKLGIRPEDQPAGWLTQFTYGINAELAEHADVTKGDLVQTGRIALAHLDEAPDYYERLARVGLEDKATAVAEPARLPGDTGTIDDEQKILHHAAVTGSVPSYLYDIAALRRLERRGLLAHPKQIADFHVFWITDAGRQAFARGVYGGELRPFSPDAPCARHDMVNAHRCDEPAGRQRQARDYDSPDDALAGVHDFLGAEWYERHGDKVTVYAQIDHVWYKATLAKSRGLYHWPSAWVDRVRALPKNVRPIARVVPGVAEPVKDNPVGADDGIPWVQITRDPERYQAAMAHAKRLGVMNEPGKVYELLAPALAKEDQEVILVVLFDVRGQCRGVAEVHRGQRSRVDVSTADIMRIVLVSGAEGFMLVHNHPSGDASPSDKDGELTKAVSKAAAVHPEIAYLDHLVIGLGQYYTFTGRKLVKVKSDIDSKPKKKKKGNRR